MFGLQDRVRINVCTAGSLTFLGDLGKLVNCLRSLKMSNRNNDDQNKAPVGTEDEKHMEPDSMQCNMGHPGQDAGHLCALPFAQPFVCPFMPFPTHSFAPYGMQHNLIWRDMGHPDKDVVYLCAHPKHATHGIQYNRTDILAKVQFMITFLASNTRCSWRKETSHKERKAMASKTGDSAPSAPHQNQILSHAQTSASFLVFWTAEQVTHPTTWSNSFVVCLLKGPAVQFYWLRFPKDLRFCSLLTKENTGGVSAVIWVSKTQNRLWRQVGVVFTFVRMFAKWRRSLLLVSWKVTDGQNSNATDWNSHTCRTLELACNSLQNTFRPKMADQPDEVCTCRKRRKTKAGFFLTRLFTVCLLMFKRNNFPTEVSQSLSGWGEKVRRTADVALLFQIEADCLGWLLSSDLWTLVFRQIWNCVDDNEIRQQLLMRTKFSSLFKFWCVVTTAVHEMGSCRSHIQPAWSLQNSAWDVQRIAQCTRVECEMSPNFPDYLWVDDPWKAFLCSAAAVAAFCLHNMCSFCCSNTILTVWRMHVYPVTLKTRSSEFYGTLMVALRTNILLPVRHIVHVFPVNPVNQRQE